MLVIGLTGSFGTGKTTVCEILTELGATIIDADKLGHELLQTSSNVRDELIAAFGENIVKPDKEIDRRKLGEIALKNDIAQARFNKIMHPRMYRMVQEKIERHRKRGDRVVVLEAALLLEAGWAQLVDQIWVTVAPETVIIQRLKRQRGLGEEQIRARLGIQMPSGEKIKHADVVIDTSPSVDDLRVELTRLWQKLQSC